MVKTQREKGEALRTLHATSGAFLIPNPWDAGSARLLESLGFKALATTSSGFAYSLGRRDGRVTLEEKLAHCKVLSAATDIPISADLENGFANSTQAVADTVRQAALAGVVGGSIEDYDSEEGRIYDFNHAVERIHAACEAAHDLDVPFALTARAENFLRATPDLDDTIKRLQAFEQAGADVLYAPGLRTLEEVRTVVASVDKPINVLAPLLYPVHVEDLASAGVRRISTGGSLCYAAMSPLLKAGREMLERGSFDWLTEIAPPAEIRGILR